MGSALKGAGKRRKSGERWEVEARLLERLDMGRVRRVIGNKIVELQ